MYDTNWRVNLAVSEKSSRAGRLLSQVWKKHTRNLPSACTKHIHDNLDIADPSSTQDAYHAWTLYMAQLATSAL